MGFAIIINGYQYFTFKIHSALDLEPIPREKKLNDLLFFHMEWRTLGHLRKMAER